MLALPAVPAAVPVAAQIAVTQPAPSELFPKLTLTAPDAPAAAVHRFFSEQQFAALEKLCDAVMPQALGRPSARDAAVAEFLDFLVKESPADVQAFYRDGLDRLAREGVSEASLAPLREAWTYSGPADAFARFLAMAKEHIVQATVNSREFSEAMSRGRRSGGGLNYYWRVG